MFRKVKFWVRVVPKKGVGKPTTVCSRIYRTKKDAKAASKKGETIINMTGFYPAHLWKRK